MCDRAGKEGASGCMCESESKIANDKSEREARRERERETPNYMGTHYNNRYLVSLRKVLVFLGFGTHCNHYINLRMVARVGRKNKKQTNIEPLDISSEFRLY